VFLASARAMCSLRDCAMRGVQRRGEARNLHDALSSYNRAQRPGWEARLLEYWSGDRSSVAMERRHSERGQKEKK